MRAPQVSSSEYETARLEVELLGIVTDNQLKFNIDIANICRKASFKLHALRRIHKFLTVEKAKILANAVIHSQFKYAR